MELHILRLQPWPPIRNRQYITCWELQSNAARPFHFAFEDHPLTIGRLLRAVVWMSHGLVKEAHGALERKD